jgi:ubiquinone/menaquinone biosynthesis C-methylase UbiE
MSPSPKIQRLIDRFYSNATIGQRALETEIHRAIGGNSVKALDAGCGIDAPLTRKLRQQIAVVGIDLCRGLPQDLPVVTGDLAKLPFPSESFSLVFSRSVFEHLQQPGTVLEEFKRVLRPNGTCIILTPNRFDYSSIAAALTPPWFHQWFVRKVYGYSDAYDTFPTVYRANTPWYFQSLAKQTNGWRIKRIVGLRHYPANLMFSVLLFRLGILYDWTIARLGLRALQPSLLVVLEKTACLP